MTPVKSQNLLIREFERQDKGAIVACMAILQDTERLFEPRRRCSDPFAEEHIDRVIDRSNKGKARIFVAIVDQVLVGFASVLADEWLEAEFNLPTPIVHITDLVVLPQFRRRGIAKALLAKAEEFGRSQGASAIRLFALKKNESAHQLYLKEGFDEYEILFLKPLKS